MRFRIEVNTLDGKLAYERETAADALAVADGAKVSLGVTIIDTETSQSYGRTEFANRFGQGV